METVITKELYMYLDSDNAKRENLSNKYEFRVEPSIQTFSGETAKIYVKQFSMMNTLVDRPRYCSEECQRAHWLAGHMDECPCHTGDG